MECAAWTTRDLLSPVHKPGHSVMFFLIAPLLFIGFFSPANSETVDSESQKPKYEHLISLRDDFVGEDQRLSALLAERMAVLQAPLNLSDLEAGGPAPEPAGPWLRDPGRFQPKHDYLHANRLPQQVNVSMDSAEYFNASDWLLAVNVSWPDPAPGPGGPPAPGYVKAPASGTGWAPGPTHSRDFRRQKTYRDESEKQHNTKLLDMMRQSIYHAQLKMMEIDPLVSKYERDPRFRIAFVYSRLKEWFHNMRTVLRAILRKRKWELRIVFHIMYYEHMLRMNIDITYSVEALVHLHISYMTSVENIRTAAGTFNYEKVRLQQKRARKLKALGLTAQPEGFVKLSTTKATQKKYTIQEYY